ncbi:MARTX multifunctional-autoprocessing repeats-in-toxin holotoxin RtxA [Providencia rettgeri]
MGQSFWRSAEYFFTGRYSADNGNNNIHAIGFGGKIYAYGGDDHITVGSIGATVYTGTGNDTVVAGAAYLNIEDCSGDLSVKGAAGYVDINKSKDGNLSFGGAAGGTSISHTGNHGSVQYSGAAFYNKLTRKGLTGDMSFKGAGGYNNLWHETNKGNLFFTGAGGGNKLDRTWFDRYQGSHGDVIFSGAGASNIINSRVETGNITLQGAGASNHIVRCGKIGDIVFQGAGAWNHIERTQQSYDTYSETRGDIKFYGVGGYNNLSSNVAHGNVYFNGGGVANVIMHSSTFGNTEFNGAGAANVIVKSGEKGDLTFRGAGLANVLVHQSKLGSMDVYAGGAVNVLIRIGDGKYLAHLLAYGNISVHKGNGSSRVIMFGGYNTHTQLGTGNGLWLAAGGYNIMTQKGSGNITSVLIGGANVLTKIGDGNVISGMLGGANIITHISGDEESSDTSIIALGGANILTKKGKGNTFAVMGGGANVLSHVGNGMTTGVMVGGANILTKIGHGDTTGIMLGAGNVLTHVGDGQTIGVMGAIGNVFTKVGDGTSIAAMIGGGNIFTHVGKGDAWALMGGLGNIFTKIGDGNALALMIAKGNVFTHVGNGTSVALMLAKANIATKVGHGMTLSAMVGAGNIFTHIGNGTTFAAMIGKANVMTKVGDDLTAALMIGKANIYTHVGNGTSIGMFVGELNLMTKVGKGTTLAVMFGKANIMTHVGDGLTGVLALGEANIVTKVGDGFMGVVAAAKANVVTHVGDATTAAVLIGKGNILTKVGEGTTVGLLISDIGNVMTHVGGGITIGLTKGKGNIITKVGDGMGINVAWGQANVLTHIGEGDRYNFAKGEANLITKVGNGQEVSVVHGKANIITHIGDGDDYIGAWGDANIITKVGDGRNVVLAKGKANIVTQIGDGDSFNALWSDGNIVTKVGDGIQVTAAKGKANITTTVGDGLSVTAAYGDANINTKVGDGISVNASWGKYNISTKVGNGLNVAVMKGKANINIHVGDGMGINASYAQNNIAIKVGNGDFYSLAVASSNTSSSKLSALFSNIKQTVLGGAGSQAINYLVQGDDASSSGMIKGRGAIKVPEVTKLDGFQLDEVKEVNSNLGNDLTGSVTNVETPDLNKLERALNVDSPDIANGLDGSQQSNTINQNVAQSGAAKNAIADKEQANAGSQKLEREKNQQLAALSGSQVQLEETDQEALKNNGQKNRKEIEQESNEITEELTGIARKFDVLNKHKNHEGTSGESWLSHFSSGTTDKVQQQISKAKDDSSKHVKETQKAFTDNQKVVKQSVQKSEEGAIKSNHIHSNVDKDINDAKLSAKNSETSALSEQHKAKNSENSAYNSVNNAQSQSDNYIKNANHKATQAQINAKNSKQNEGDRPERRGALGSGLSNQISGTSEPLEKMSHINVGEQVLPDGKFSQGLIEEFLSEDEIQAELEDTLTNEELNIGKNAVDRLQIKSAHRANNKKYPTELISQEANTNSGSVLTTEPETKVDSSVAQTKVSELTDTYRNSIRMSGINLEGLSGNKKVEPETSQKWSNDSVSIVNDRQPVRNEESSSLLTRRLNNELYGDQSERRYLDNVTQDMLNYNIDNGEADKITLKGNSGRLTGYYHYKKKNKASDLSTKEPQKVVLFLHGSGSPAEDQVEDISRHYKDLGIDTLAVNMRGFGESDGMPTEVGLYQDARTMYHYLVNDKGIDPSNIIIHGYSMGAPVAADLARYAVMNGKAPSGLLLDRPMPSMTKAVAAYSMVNSSGLFGLLSKTVNGQFSVEKNLEGLSKETPIMLLTDNEKLGKKGEELRSKLLKAGFNVAGEKTFYAHEASNSLMSEYADEIISHLSEISELKNRTVKGGVLNNIGFRIFDFKAKGKEIDKQSFHFSQGGDLLDKLVTLIPEVGNKLVTNGNDAKSKEFREGLCFALSARYMIEERVNGLGGGKAYIEWLKDIVQAYNDNTPNKKLDIDTVADKLLNQYRRQDLGLVIKDLLSLQFSQLMDASTSAKSDIANKEYGGKLKANGLTGPNIDNALNYASDGYESVLDKLRSVNKPVYMTFMSQGHAMSVVVHKKDNKKIWSFFDPNYGGKSFSQYDDFRQFMDNFHKGPLTKYKYQPSEEPSQSFYVSFNKFENGDISSYDGLWKNSRDGEKNYVLKALKEQGKTFSFGKNLVGKIIDFGNDVITMEVVTKNGSKVIVDVKGTDSISEATKFIQSNIDQVIAVPLAHKVSLNWNSDDHLNETSTLPEQKIQGFSDEDIDKITKKSKELSIDRKNYESRDLVLEPIKNPESVTLGIPEVDQKILADIAEQDNLIIAIRPIDEKSKSLIASKLYSSKGLFVKAKSSDWGPMSGFIPVDQFFAKESARKELVKFNSYAEQSIESGNAVSVDLHIDQARIDELTLKYKSLTPLELDPQSGLYKTTATNGAQDHSFYLKQVIVDNKSLWQVHYMKDGNLTPFQVIGDPLSKKPITADYDLLTVMHHYQDLGPMDKVKQPLEWSEWKGSVTYEDLTPSQKELYNNEALYNKCDGRSLGVISDRVKKVKDRINASLGRTNGMEMVHHGADDANPYAVIGDNFPATFFVPKIFFTNDGLGHGKGAIQTYFNVNEQGAVVIRNQQELSNFLQVAINVNYRASFNDRWNIGADVPLFTKERKLSHSFKNAQEEIKRRFSSDSRTSIDESIENKQINTIDTLPVSEVLDQVISDLNKSSTIMSEIGFYDPKKFESGSAREKAEWKQILTNINNIRNMYFPHDLARYFEALKTYKVGNCGDRSMYAAHLIMNKYNFDGEVELLKLKGSGDHVFVRIGGTSDSAKIIDPWTGQYFSYSQIDTFLYNPKNKKVEVHRSFDDLKTLFKDIGADTFKGSSKIPELGTVTQKEKLSEIDNKVNNQNIQSWERIIVTPIENGGETRFDGQIIIQLEDDPTVAKATANLAGKHPEKSVVVQLDAEGNYRVVHGDPSLLSGKLRWQLVGHGRNEAESNNMRLSGYNADEIAVRLAKFNQDFSQTKNIAAKPEHISIVGCSLVSDDKRNGFAHNFITEMNKQGIRSTVSARSTEVAIDEAGRKYTRDTNDQWAHKQADNKVVLSWNEKNEVVTHNENIHNRVAEGDIDLARVGQVGSDTLAKGAIGDNTDVFTVPNKRRVTETSSSDNSSKHLSYSGNIQVNVGDGEFTTVNWGTSNIGVKVGTGGVKSLNFGDNNVMIHVGDGESKHSFNIAGYQALEGAQMFVGTRNISFNMGRSNDLIVMSDKSIPTPPLINPFDSASQISGALQRISDSGKGDSWLTAQEQQWTLAGAKKFVKDMSGIDLTSNVDYTTLTDLDSQNERSSRGLKSDTETTLNKHYNNWLNKKENKNTSNLSRADKLRQNNEKLAFNFAVGGQGSDIQVTAGNWNLMFGDNIQALLDTNLGSLFGLMTQQFSATGQAKTTFTYNPKDFPRQLKNKLLSRLASVSSDTTLGDIFGVDYTASGHIISRNGEAVDGTAILTEMIELIGKFCGEQLKAFTDPSKLLDSLKSGIDMGADGIKSFAESHGLKEKEIEEDKKETSVSVNGINVASTEQETGGDSSSQTTSINNTEQEKAFGFNALNLPNLFATIFSKDKQTEMKSLVENMKENLASDLMNMEKKTFDFLRNSGHLKDDGDVHISLGNYNFNWGGAGKDLGAYLGDNNNFWGGAGDDVYYATGTSNIFTGGKGDDTGILMGRENMMFGGDGNDIAVIAGRINNVFMGAGDDQSFVFGEDGVIDTGAGRDYVVTSGNFNRIDTGKDQDYSVIIGNNNQIELGENNDFANIFGNYNRINGGSGDDAVKLMGYHAVIRSEEGNDILTASSGSKFSQFDGGLGSDLVIMGGYQNTFSGGHGKDSFMINNSIIDCQVKDISSEDNIVFNNIDWNNLWFKRSGYDLKLSILRDPKAKNDQDKFESVGSVTFTDYFNSNQAELIISMGSKNNVGEREYTSLSENAVNILVQAMSSFAPQSGDNGFISSLDSRTRAIIGIAWSDITKNKGVIA